MGEGGGDNGGLLPSIHPREKSGPGTVSNTDIPTFPHECQFFVILICSNMKIFSDTTKHIWFSDGRNRRFFKTSVSDPCHFGAYPYPRIHASVMDPDPVVFAIGLQDSNKKLIFKKVLLLFTF